MQSVDQQSINDRPANCNPLRFGNILLSAIYVFVAFNAFILIFIVVDFALVLSLSCTITFNQPNAKHLPAETCGCARCRHRRFSWLFLMFLIIFWAAVVAHYNSLPFSYARHSIQLIFVVAFNQQQQQELCEGKELLCHLQIRIE